MGYFGKLEEKYRAQALRHKGYSYREILNNVSVSKDTLSRWCKDIPLSETQQERLMSLKKFGQKKGSLIAAENKRIIRIATINRIFGISRKEIGRLSKRERFIAGVALYAAEGDKTEGKGGFSNSDPNIIRFMMKWFLEFTNIPIEKLHGAIWIHDNLDKHKSQLFWTKLTGIPAKQFYKTYIAKNKVNSRKIRKNLHLYGVFAIRFSQISEHRRILGWISALFGDRISPVH